MSIETERGYRVTLSFAQRKVIWLLSERGGQVDLDPTNFDQHARDGLQDLHVKGLIIITPLVGRSTSNYKLTELGIQVADQIRKTQ